MFISLLFRALFLEFVLLFFDCFPNCAKPKNIENPLVLIQYVAFGTFRKRTKKIKEICKNASSFSIDFSSKIKTFSASKSASILASIFLEKWLPKGGQKSHFFTKNRPVGPQGSIYSAFWEVLEGFEKRSIFRYPPKSSLIDPCTNIGPPPKKMKIRLSSHTRLQRSKLPGQHPIIKEIQGKKD